MTIQSDTANLLEKYVGLETSTKQAKQEFVDHLSSSIDAYFAQKVKTEKDSDLRRDYASLRQAKDFIVESDGTLTFKTANNLVSHNVSLFELTK